MTEMGQEGGGGWPGLGGRKGAVCGQARRGGGELRLGISLLEVPGEYPVVKEGNENETRKIGQPGPSPDVPLYTWDLKVQRRAGTYSRPPSKLEAKTAGPEACCVLEVP